MQTAVRLAPIGVPRAIRFVLAATLFATTATACAATGGDGASGGATSTAAEQPRKGGTIVLAAGEPICMDWYAQCGIGNVIGIAPTQTLPSPMDFVEGQFRVTPLLADEPTVEAGPPQRITYRINQAAVWSDGTAITSADFRYTWEQARTNNARGMGDIAAVDDTDPRTAVVTWRSPNATWRERFRPLLPKHLLQGKDRNAEMKDGYTFSGGPWMLGHWTRGQEFKLVRNPRYWGPPAYLDAVVSRVTADAAATRQAYKSGQIDMFVQSGAEIGIEEMRGLPDTGFLEKSSLGYAFLSFNTQRAPLDRKAVRQALAYAVDRDAVALQLQGHLRPGAKPIQSLASSANPTYYSEPFARYRRDLTKGNELMRADGWAKGSDGVWAKGDTRARLDLIMSVGSFNTLIAQVFESQWEEAGFEVAVRHLAGGPMTELLSKGEFHIGGGSSPAALDPGQCARFCSSNIPSEATRFVGGNLSRITSPALDDLWARADTELDAAKRVDLVRRGQEAVAEEVPALPIVAIIDVYGFNSKKLGGPVTVGPGYADVAAWFCRTTCP